ncbi:hypothetical protein [Streptomyces sp. NPDC008139]|uniref:hypothetical protein n=1 Tax=Streptomyces sp. NPDC008139 TaxID=3364814 RepID=UPI0036DFD3C9
MDAFEDAGSRPVGGDEQHGLAASGGGQPSQTDGEMRRRARRHAEPQERGGEFGHPAPGGLVVEVRGEVPRLVRVGADEQQRSRPALHRGSEGPAEGPGGARPLRSGEHFAQQRDPYGVHGTASFRPRSDPRHRTPSNTARTWQDRRYDYP